MEHVMLSEIHEILRHATPIGATNLRIATLSHDTTPSVPHEEQQIMDNVVFQDKDFPFKKRKWVAFSFH